MNSLSVLARRYDTRTLSAIASSSRSPSSPGTPRQSRRTFSFSAADPTPKRLAKRPASSPSTPSRLSTPLTDIPPPLLFPIPPPHARRAVKARHKFIVQCYAIVWRVVRAALVWTVPTAARAIQHAELDGEEKAVTYDTASEESDKALDESDSGDRVLPGDNQSNSLLGVSLTPIQTLNVDLSKESPPAEVNVTPPTPVDQSAPYSHAKPFAMSPLRLFHTPSSAAGSPICQSLLPNPLAMSLLTSSPAAPSLTRNKSDRQNSPFPVKKTLVLDLDETLIHSTSRALSAATGGTGMLGLGGLFGKRSQGTGHMVEVILNGRSTLYHVYKRPFADYFLRKVSGWYTLVIFTASMQEYADPVIDWLDGGRGLFSRRFFRESCTQQQSGSYTKDLSVIDEDLSRICLIDNSPVSYSNHPANGIPIEGWISDPSDEALLDLLPVLDSLRFANDVRRILGIRGF